ncbi:MAG: hypothetical protein WCD37_00785 [Chloroflexia bacterium]
MLHSTSQPEHMHCVYCGQQLPTNAEVCYRCGSGSPLPKPPYKPLIATASDQNFDVETCELGWIRKASGLHGRIFFQAQANGPDGLYIVATAEPVPEKMEALPSAPSHFIPSPTSEAMSAVSQLVDTLVHDGWEPTERGGFWWNYRFHRILGHEPERPGNDTRRIDRYPEEAG